MGRRSKTPTQGVLIYYKLLERTCIRVTGLVIRLIAQNHSPLYN
jgi:hypothetical protein